ncbi:hypothetical protein K2O51_23255 [Cupriavidus pinatubonensis]|uniref:hypothetical protein n=1 Tax=Cupriavidus pinatubonensis TaxID=248026 RepID=UPI001C72C89F|nr:hypothetical protein [Cupriavidus pinatubonensis]QYY30290.1 hypothetical protein K2O51_23255 [Cupriavidus pinatubonensis]
MTANETSAEHLEWWIGIQKSMVEETRKHLDTLVQQKQREARNSADPATRTWLDDAIADAHDSIANLQKSITFAESGLALAREGRLHDPRR